MPETHATDPAEAPPLLLDPDKDHKQRKKDKKKKKKKRKKRHRQTEDEEKSDNNEQQTPAPPVKRQRIREGSVQTKEEDANAHQTSTTPSTTTLLLGEKPDTGEPSVKRKRKKKRKKDRRAKNLNVSLPPDNLETEAAKSSQEVEPESDNGTEPPDDDVGAAAAVFPFPTEPDDHCESPIQAYAHIQPLLLQLLCHHQNNNDGKTTASSSTSIVPGKELRIYDPYYCNGSVIDNLTALGFPSVYNKKEDCYQVWSTKSAYPDFDVLITNPPYSGDHIEKLLEHVTSHLVASRNRPWFLLMPDWVHKKDYFQSLMKRKQVQPFYLVPKKRYVYLPPKHYRASKKSDVHKKSSPFNSMWYVWGGSKERNDQLIRYYYNTKSCTFPILATATAPDTDTVVESSTLSSVNDCPRMPLSEACDLARSKSALRDLRRKHNK